MDTYHELIESIRESRKAMSEACGHDSRRYIAYLESFNTKYSEQVRLSREWQGSKVAQPIVSQE